MSVQTPTSRLTRSVVRGTWVALALIHTPILLAVLSGLSGLGISGEQIASVLSLVLATSFFTLKALDVPWLRFRTSRHGVWVFLLAAAIAHHEAIGSDAAAAPGVVIGIAAVDEIVRGGRRLLGSIPPLLATPRAPLAVVGVLRETPHLPSRTRRRLTAASPRAPPYSAT